MKGHRDLFSSCGGEGRQGPWSLQPLRLITGNRGSWGNQGCVIQRFYLPARSPRYRYLSAQGGPTGTLRAVATPGPLELWALPRGSRGQEEPPSPGPAPGLTLWEGVRGRAARTCGEEVSFGLGVQAPPGPWGSPGRRGHAGPAGEASAQPGRRVPGREGCTART